MKLSEFHFRPDRIVRDGAAHIAAADDGTFDGTTDFGSYRGVNTGSNFEWVRQHGIHDDRTAERYVADVAGLAGLRKGLSVLDLGSGLGFITNAFARLLGSNRTVGLELSPDGVAYARRTYPGCTFIQIGVEPGTEIDELFDVVHAKGLYAFCRTDDLDINSGYLAFCVRHLKPGGFLIVTHNHGPDDPGLLANIRRGTLPYADLGLSPFVTRTAAMAALRNRLPLPAARILSPIVRLLLRRSSVAVCVSRRLAGPLNVAKIIQATEPSPPIYVPLVSFTASRGRPRAPRSGDGSSS